MTAGTAGRGAEGQQNALQDRDPIASDDEIRVGLPLDPQPIAFRACPVGRVEAELPRLELGNRDPARGTCIPLAEEVGRLLFRSPLPVRPRSRAVGARAVGAPTAVPVDLGDAVRHAQRGGDRVGQSFAVRRADDQPIDDDPDVVVPPPVEPGGIGEIDEPVVDPGAHEAFTKGAFEQIPELALATADEGREHLDPRALRPLEQPGRDLRRRLGPYGPAARGTVRRSGPGPEQPEEVIDLGDGADGRTRVAPRGALLDRDRGRQPLDLVDIGLLHHAQELARVRRQGLDVAALPLRIDGVERQRRLAGAREPRHDGETIPRDLHGDVPEIVLAGAPDDERISGLHISSS